MDPSRFATIYSNWGRGCECVYVLLFIAIGAMVFAIYTQWKSSLVNCGACVISTIDT